MTKSKSTIKYKKLNGIAWVTMNRPEYNNAQNGKMTYDLDKAFKKAVDDDDIKVIVLNGNGKHFSAGHDIGTPGRDIHKSYDRKTMWYTIPTKKVENFCMSENKRFILICVEDGEIYQNQRLLWFMVHVLLVVVC